MVFVSADPGGSQTEMNRKDTTQMNSIGKKLAGVGLGALFVIGLGGAGLAYAQTDDSTTTTTGPSATAPASPSEDPDCPHKNGRGGGADAGSLDRLRFRSPLTGRCPTLAEAWRDDREAEGDRLLSGCGV